jgi:hypothetical protein
MAEDTAEEQPGLPAHLRDDLKWKPGQSGNPAGRPKGARSKLSESFLETLLKDFQKASAEDETVGAKAIAAMRAEKPNEYARMIASILAKEVEANVNGDVSPELKRWLGWTG